MATRSLGPDRRRFLGVFAGAGLGSTLLPGVVWARLQDGDRRLTADSLAACEAIAGLELTEAERLAILGALEGNRASYRRLRDIPIANDVAPSFGAVTAPAPARVAAALPCRPPTWSGAIPGEADLPFLSAGELGRLVQSRAITSEQLTRLYLARLERYDSDLHCVITLMADRALSQAREADAAIKAGAVRSPLHGVPWGVKDLMAVPGHPTTWGAKPFADQVLERTATVVRRLDDAGAVLLAKLSVGALAMGDVWFRHRTNNPWNPKQGSSGSSAGSAAAVAAGLCGFAIGTETLGSIVSPVTRCGVTGLRPTFGRVSRHGVMALSWSMDKVGPIARTVEDCGLVLDQIAGPDGEDDGAADRAWPDGPTRPLHELRIGYVKGAFDADRSERERAVLDVLRGLGVDLVPVELPEGRYRDLLVILTAEAGCAFDDITRDGRVHELVSQGRDAWPDTFREARFIPAVEYLRACRARRLLMQQTAGATRDVDVFVAPTFAGGVLTLTNLTGHPAICLPAGFAPDGTPRSITFVGSLFGERDLMTVAAAYQDATDHHLKRPPIGG